MSKHRCYMPFCFGCSILISCEQLQCSELTGCRLDPVLGNVIRTCVDYGKDTDSHGLASPAQGSTGC